MAIIVDADVIIRGEKGSFDFSAWTASRPADRFEVAAVTVAELWHGVERAATARQRSTRERYLNSVLSVMMIVSYTEQTAQIHARLWAELESRGTMIGYYDLIVAATALERHSELATFNTRHFRHVADLKIIEPS